MTYECPSCSVERLDVEDLSRDQYLPTCPNCGSDAIPRLVIDQ